MVDASERVFRVLMRLYPAAFRRRFEAEMLEFFRIRSGQRRGWRRRAGFVVRTLVDGVRSLVREHTRGFMTRLDIGANRPGPARGGAFAGDVRYASRMLVRNPGFTAIACLTLALGIGANVAMFSLAHAMFLAPLPFRDADRLVSVWERRGTSSDANLTMSGHEYAALAEQNRAFSGVALYAGDIRHLTGAGDPEAIEVIRTSANFFRTIGIDAAIGRAFVDGEDGPAARVVLLSDAFWQRRFGGDRAIVGRHIALNDQAFLVIGVMPPMPPSLAPDAFVPLDMPAQIRAVGRHNLTVVARLAADVTIEQAHANVNAIAARLAQAMPRENTGHAIALIPVRAEIAGEFRTAVTALLAAVGCVLLIGCANVANLLLTRGAGRQKEMAVRIALGASRFRIVRQLLAESVMLATIGGAAGLLLAAWIVDVVPAMAAERIPLIETARIDWRVVTVTIGLSILTGLAAGVAPALRSSRTHPKALREGSRISDDPEHRRLRSLLVAAEVALTLVLLVGAGLLINSFVRLLSVNPGFEVERVLVLGVDLPESRYARADERRAFVDRLVERVRGIPGAETVGATSQLPLGGSDNWMPFAIEGRPSAAPGAEPTAAFRVVTPDYFRALSIPLKRGRFFTDADARLAVPLVRWFPQQPYPAQFDAPQPVPVALVGETTARQFWPGEDPVGRRFQTLFSPQITIVGVVGDVRHSALHTPASPHIYLSHNQEPWGSLSVVVRTSNAPLAMAPLVRDQFRALDPALPVGVRTMDDVVAASIGERRFHVVLISAFGSVALGLAIVGIVGVVSYAAAQRTREIGVRIALGAQRREIAALMIGQGMRPIVAGLIIGSVVALYLTRFIETMLFGVEPTDPLTFSGVVVLLGTIALLACWVPARRASKVDPALTLRAD